jgi:hypothetical protein
MLLLRLAGVLTAIAIASGIVAYLFTGERRYLGLAWRVAKYALLATFVILSLLLLERVVALA